MFPPKKSSPRSICLESSSQEVVIANGVLVLVLVQARGVLVPVLVQARAHSCWCAA